ncbi:hypothetical protein BH11ACT1_BH11ACT1_31300 [soil metagenome]
MPTTIARRLLLTLPDVAALARVQRPVPSMWRTRLAATATPFPTATVTSGAQELFDAHEVADWLVSTEHGTNPHVREELALFAAFDDASGLGAEVVFAGMTALLALKVATGQQLAGQSAAEVLDLADDVDPLDQSLYSEIAALGEDLTAYADHADAMASAAYTPAAAFESLMAHRGRWGLRTAAERALAPAARDLVARLAAGLTPAEHAGVTAVVDPSGGSDLLVTLRPHLADDAPMSALIDRTHEGSRLAERRLRTHGWHVGAVAVDDGGRLALPGACTVVSQLPPTGAARADDAAVLTALDDVALAMSDDDRAVVVGPSRVLTGALSSRESRSARADVLRTDRVRAIVRLPAGLLPAHPRHQLALWVLGPAHPDVAIADRWTTVADLSSSALDAATVSDLLTDVIAAMGGRTDVRVHAFRFARLVPTSALLASSGDLVGALRLRARRSALDPADAAIRVQELLAALGPQPGVHLGVHVEHCRRSATQRVTLGELAAARAVRLVPGHRIATADVTTGQSVRVIGPDELLGRRALGERTLDRLVFSTRYPAARYTEPGDVVFCSTPGIGALVDRHGLSVVQFPARILRVDHDRAPGLVAEVLAADLRSAPVVGGWRTWPVRVAPPGRAPALAATLDRVTDARAEAARRLAALDELAATLVDGVTSGALTLNSSPVPDDDQHDKEG